jgi:hypothetical protein
MFPKARSWGAALAVLLVAAAGFTLPGPAAAARLPGCVASELRVVRRGTEGALSHRYDIFAVANTGRRTCRLRGYPTFRFRDAGGSAVGYTSAPAGVPMRVVRLRPGQRTRVTVATIDPAVTLPRQCRAVRATSVDIRLAARRHVYHRVLKLRVCTTKRYRPVSYPVGF